MAHRILMAFLGSQWKTLTPQQRVTWEALASVDAITPYNAFISHNMARYRNIGTHHFQPLGDDALPTQAYPTTETQLPADLFNYEIAGLPLAVRFNWTIADIRQNWGIAIHHAWSTHNYPTLKNLIHITTFTDPAPGSLTISNLKPGLYQTITYRFSTDGRPHTYWVARQAVVGPEASPPPHPGPPQPPPPPPIPF